MSVALVTGANRNPGIGYEIVRGLSKSCDFVILTARDATMGKEAVKSLKANHQVNNIVFHQLDIADEASVERLRLFVEQRYRGLDILVNNAGVAFPMQDKTPFATQARRSIDVNYYGTKRMIKKFRPLLRKGARLVGISSTSGQLGSAWSAARKEELLREDLTLDGLDVIAEEFVAHAAEGDHKAHGFPGTAYGTSKTLMTQLHRVFAQELDASEGFLCTAVCPGLCRTHMATGRGTLMSNLLWAVSFVVGNSAAGGADTPVWLCCELKEEDRENFHGKFVRSRKVEAY